MRLIDADALMEELKSCHYPGAPYVDAGISIAIGKVCDAPTIEERKTGRWIKLDAHAHLADHKCTACGQECYVPTCMGEPMYTYCPNCGADMRGEAE